MTSIFGNIDNKSALVSYKNAYDKILSASTTYTGIWEDVSQYSEITIFVVTDQTSATDGFNMQFSTDGLTAQRSKSITHRNGSTGSVHTLAVTTQYFRITYEAGATNTNLNIQVIYHKQKSKSLTSSTSQVISDQNDVELTRTVNSHQLDLARQVVSDKSVIHKFGHSALVNATESTIWSPGGNITFPTTAETLVVIAGGNVDDDIAGTGARTIVIEGLDANWAEQTEVIELAGSSASAPSVGSYIRLNRAYIASTGTDHGSNTGDIIIQNSTSGQTLGDIVAGFGQTQLGHYSVPASHSAYLTRIEINVDASTNKTGSVAMWRYDNTRTGAPKRIVWKADSISGQETTKFESYVSFNQKEDIEMRATATATSDVSVNYDLIMIHYE